MSIVLIGSTSGSITLQEPAVSGTTVLDLPAVSGTILTTTSPKAGNVIQVVQATYSTEVNISSTSYVDSGLSASITPSSSSSKILVIASMSGDVYRQSNNVVLTYQNIVRGSTTVTEKYAYFSGAVSADSFIVNLANTTLNYLDSPATTSSTTYKVQAKLSATANNATVRYQTQGGTSVIILMEIAG